MKKGGDNVSKKQENEKFYSLLTNTVFKYLFMNPKTRSFFMDLILFYTHMEEKNFKLVDEELLKEENFENYSSDIILVNKEKSILLSIDLNKNHPNYQKLKSRKYFLDFMETFNNLKQEEKIRLEQLTLNGFFSTENKCLSNKTYLKDEMNNYDRIMYYNNTDVFLPLEANSYFSGNISKKIKLLFCNSYEEMKEIIEDDEELMIILEELEKMNQNEYYKKLYNIEENEKIIKKDSKEFGYEEGKNETLKKIVLKMVERNISKDKIKDITNLSYDEIETIIHKNRVLEIMTTF